MLITLETLGPIRVKLKLIPPRKEVILQHIVKVVLYTFLLAPKTFFFFNLVTSRTNPFRDLYKFKVLKSACAKQQFRPEWSCEYWCAKKTFQ